MVFSSITFLFYFLPILFLLYVIAPTSCKNLVLLLGSLFFYAFGEPVYILLLLFSTGLNFLLGQFIARRKSILVLSITTNIGLLVYFKYLGLLLSLLAPFFPFLSESIPVPALPLGISFYTFQILAYLIDVYRGKIQPQKKIIDFAMYVTLFPQLIAGPIVRYQNVVSDLHDRKPDLEQGVKLFVLGLFEKVILANQIGLIFEETTGQALEALAAPSAWLSIIAYALQIFYDFAGYSNMAIGLGLFFGFHFPRNFDRPYSSRSITEFWRRWHMTLGSWFREYVYIPLGGNQKGLLLQLRNVLIVWLLTGLWHGAHLNFLAWGLYFGFLLVLEKLFLLKLLDKLPGFFQHLYSLVLILFGWVLFAFESLPSCIAYLQALFRLPAGTDSYFLYQLRNNWVLLLIACILAFQAPYTPKEISETTTLRSSPLKFLFSAGKLLLFLFLLVLITANLVDNSYNPFLYFRF